MAKIFVSSLLLAIPILAADGALLQGTLLDVGCSAIGAGADSSIPRGTASATATGAGTTGAYSGMGTSGAGSQAGMAGTTAGAVTTRKTEKALSLPKSTSATATGAGTSGAYATNGIAGSTEPVTASASNVAREKYSECKVGKATTAFAVQTGDAVILLNEASNLLVIKKLKTKSWKANRSQDVLLQGKMVTDRFEATSVMAKP